MNTQEMMRILDSIARDRNIDRSVLIADLEQAMVSACRKFFNTLDAEEFACKVDPIAGTMQLYRHGQPLEMEPKDFGRIAAQTFKQVMIQRFRDDERMSILGEFTKRVGEIVTGTAQRYEGGSLIVTIDRAESFMPRSEQIPGEQFAAGDRVRCLILDVRDMGNQVKIVVSRGHPDFIKRLFEVEVPEVAERIIEVKAMAREAGYRTKIAVASIDSKVDAVGACVGVRGSRIKNIVDELNGEKIDIVRWNESSQILIQNALKPAEVSEISLCFELGRATVVVRDDQLSLAIGKRGQNVRLAARLTGWDIDILTPDEFNKGLEILSETLLNVEGVGEDLVDRLAAAGMVSVFDIEEVGADVLVNEFEVEPELAQSLVQICSEKAKVVAEVQQREKEEAERRRREEAEAAQRLLVEGIPAEGLDAETAAAAILGMGSAAGGGDTASAEERAGEILGDSTTS
ncbi:MAG: transcription termination/antitermination protein NusA [Phycisphaeraceae bacterium]|nr:transcription termination/antitermination protein NusA [Phycisphaeraceae bacterium]MCW5753253.1 transcription termination/antitermination protein NusA [Phycisphaeraceae bacterium]